MRLPAIDDFEFTPLMWKEWIEHGDQSEFGTKRRIYRYLQEHKEDFEWCSGIKNYVRQRRIRRLLTGYAILDILDSSRAIEFSRFKMWRFFEDLVGEIIKTALRNRKECTVVYVNRWPGFPGLDYVVINSKSSLGWKVGVQCKRYIGSRVPFCRVEEFPSYTRGVSSAQLLRKAQELKKKLAKRRKIVLTAFNAYRRKPSEENRFNKMKDEWDSVLVLDRNITDETPYMYQLNCDGLEKIVNWC